MKIFVTGASGQLGYEVTKELLNRQIEVIPSDCVPSFSLFSNYVSLDLTNKDNVEKIINQIKPDVIIHCAAYTAVDNAEIDKDKVYKINALATKYLSEISAKINAKMVLISTDYVFDGKSNFPYEIDSLKNPLSVYGKSKDDAEEILKLNTDKYFIVRTSGVFGINGNNFVKTMLKLASSSTKEINVVNDQIMSVTYAKDLANFLVTLIETDKYGIYHVTNEGYLSWFDFAKAIFKESNIEMKVNPISTDEYRKMKPNQALRPMNSRLSHESLISKGFSLLPTYSDALLRYLTELKQNEN